MKTVNSLNLFKSIVQVNDVTCLHSYSSNQEIPSILELNEKSVCGILTIVFCNQEIPSILALNENSFCGILTIVYCFDIELKMQK